jgi:hypothetical protein
MCRLLSAAQLGVKSKMRILVATKQHLSVGRKHLSHIGLMPKMAEKAGKVQVKVRNQSALRLSTRPHPACRGGAKVRRLAVPG